MGIARQWTEIRRGVLLHDRLDAVADAEGGLDAARQLMARGFAIASWLGHDRPAAAVAITSIGWEPGANWVVDSRSRGTTVDTFQRAPSLAAALNRERGSRVFTVPALLSAELARRPGAGSATLVLTNGVFDLLHLGHVRSLQAARSYGDVLVVAVNSDLSAARIKRRPTVPQFARAAMLASLRVVDYVVLFDAPTPREIISALRPGVLAKGGDYRATDVEGSELLAEWGGRVQITPHEPGFSTTHLIRPRA